MSRLSLLVLAAFGTCADAHESRPIHIEVNEHAPLHYELQWKIPPSVPLSSAPSIGFPDGCKAQSRLVEFTALYGSIRRINYSCEYGLGGRVISIIYPGPNPSVSSLIRYRSVAGERHVALMGPQQTEWKVPHAETRSGVARHYALLGVQHIWAGTDHLLFLVCLLCIASTWRRILITITGFTLAHSLTLVLSALDVVRLSTPPVEAAIALSVVFLATEIVQGPRQTLTWRYPIVVSTSFGLLHGFGFAAALSEIGLPQTELVTGLLFFNVGVEIGQVLFAAGVVGLMRIWQRFGIEWLAEVRRAAALRVVTGYAVGTLGAFWVCERVAAF